MALNTKISSQIGGSHAIYGHSMEDLIQNASFTDSVFLLYTGRIPKPGERTLLDAMLVSATEHGIEVPSLYVPRVSAASGNSVHVAIAAGTLAIGTAHGGAGEAAARLLSRVENADEIVAEYIEKKKRLPGFGHKTYKDADPRATLIESIAKTSGVSLTAFTKARDIESALAKAGKKLPLNIDGAFAAATLSLGMPPEAAQALFVLARVAGMGAHAIEELQQQNGYHRLSESGEITTG